MGFVGRVISLGNLTVTVSVLFEVASVCMLNWYVELFLLVKELGTTLIPEN
jgi:hypothetical protein